MLTLEGGEIRLWEDQGVIMLKAVDRTDPVEMTETSARELAHELLRLADGLSVGASQLSSRLEGALLAAAGEGRAVVPVSFSIDYGASPADAEPAIETRIDRSTRTLVFASAEARLPDGRKAAAASGVYRVEQA